MKNRFKLKPSVPAFLVAVLTLTAVQGSSPDRLGKYDFSYESKGDSRARPAQVFDDGKSTFFQFRPGDALPAIFAATPNGPQLLVPVVEGPYVRVPIVTGTFTLRVGQSSSQVAYLGSGRDLAPSALGNTGVANEEVAMARLLAASGQIQGLPPEMVVPARRIDVTANSYATPLKGDRVEWTTTETASPVSAIPFVKGRGSAGPQASRQIQELARAMVGAKRVVVTGIDDRSYAEGLAEQRAQAVVEVLLKAGVSKETITVKSSAQPLEGDEKSIVTGAQIVSYSSRTLTPQTSPVMARNAPGLTQGQSRDDALTRVVSQLNSGDVSPASALEKIRDGSSTSVGAPVAAVGRWDVLASDGDVGAMLVRWGKASGWRVVVKDAPQVQIYGDAVVERPTFLMAADYAITQAKKAGFPIQATAYSNQVLLITAGESK